jgi:hypothetical protein
MNKNGTCPRTDNLKFGHVLKDNGKIMTSPKTQINFYNTLLLKSIWHHIVGKSIKKWC